MQQSRLDNITLTPEELLGPPKVDFIGLVLMSFVALVIGFLIGIIVFLLSFLLLGSFSLQSGASPILLAMITFFATVIGNYLYLWGLVSIFPNIYSRSRTLALHVSIFSIALYIVMSIIYFFIDSISLPGGAILSVYIAHIILDVFGLILLTGILSLYRYSLLIFYASFIAFLLSAIIPISAFLSFSPSANTLFVFMVFSSIAFGLSTLLVFVILYIYHKIYTISGYDPLGDVLSRIAQDELALEKKAEKALFQ